MDVFVVGAGWVQVLASFDHQPPFGEGEGWQKRYFVMLNVEQAVAQGHDRQGPTLAHFRSSGAPSSRYTRVPAHDSRQVETGGNGGGGETAIPLKTAGAWDLAWCNLQATTPLSRAQCLMRVYAVVRRGLQGCVFGGRKGLRVIFGQSVGIISKEQL